MAKRLPRAGHYYSLNAIADVAGCAPTTLRNRIVRYKFPAFKVATDRGSTCWYSNDMLITAWWQARIEQSWREIAASKTGKARAYTRGANILIHEFTTDDASWVD